MERERAVAAAVDWLHAVEPQLGESADFAQVDVDTLVPVRGQIKKQLALISADMFRALALHRLREQRQLYLELSIPVDPGELGSEPSAGAEVSALLDLVDFRGSLRGRAVPGFFLSTWVPSDRVEPKLQRRTRLSYADLPGSVVHFRAEVWGDIHDPMDNWRQDALEFRMYPPQRPFREAAFG